MGLDVGSVECMLVVGFMNNAVGQCGVHLGNRHMCG